MSSAPVGRDAEVRQLDARLDHAASGIGGLVVITGEPGIGKTALARESMTRAVERGFDVAWSACWQTAAVPALWPWTQLLAQLAGPTHAAPALTSATDDVETGRAEQAASVTEWLRDRGRTPAMLVLDDLHWADAGTLALLTHVAASLPAAPLIIIATVRPARTDVATQYAESLPQLRRWGDELHLDGLDVDGTAELVASATGVVPSSDAARVLQELTGGNPLFAGEVGRTLRADDLAGPIDVQTIAVPGSVTELIAERLTGLSPACRTLLDALAVAGDEAPIDVLTVAVDPTHATVLDAVDEGRRAGVVAHHDGSVAFTHALFRAAVYELLSLNSRARLHDAIGRALLERRQAGAAVDAAALAHHFGRSAPLGNAPLAFEFAIEAANEAAAMLSFDVAVRRLEQALALVAVDPTLGAALPITLDLADALVAAGDVERARATFADAAGDARRKGDALALGRAALGYSGGMAGIEVLVGDRAVCDLLAEASAQLADDDTLGPLVEARLSVALSYIASLEERTAIAESACERARRVGDPATIAQTVAAWADIIAGPDYLEERLAAASEVIEQSVVCGDARIETLGRRLRVEALLEAGRLMAADLEVDRYEASAARLGRSEYAWYPALWRAALALARGDVDEQRRQRSMLDAMATIGGTNARLLTYVHDMIAAMDARDPKAAWRAYDEIKTMDLPLEEVQFRIAVSLVSAQASAGKETNESVAPLATEALAADRDSEWVPMVTQLAELVAEVGDVATAAAVRQALEPYGSVWSVEGIGAAIRGPANRLLGRLAALMGDGNAATAFFASAREAAAQAGASYIVALVDRDSGAAGSRPVASPAANRFAREGESWSITFGGVTASLRDTKGLRDIVRLISEPGREIAAVDLAAVGGAVVEGGTGEAIDATARDAYRQRLIDVESELDEADANSDTARSTALTAERDALLDELRGAYGLGGRARESGGSAERARTAVRARIRNALDRIDAVNPGLGRHLTRSIRTGVFCVYDPDPPVDWEM